MSGRFDICALARAVRLRREACEQERERRVPITSAMSRILENDSEYVSYRPRKAQKRVHPARNPGIGTVVEIAAALDTTVGALLGEPQYRIGIAERRAIRRVLACLTVLLDLDAPEVRQAGAVR